MASPNIRIHHAFENSDSIARKPEIKSTTRKPFVDRSVNATPLHKNKVFPVKQLPLKQDKIKTPKPKSPVEKYPDWLLDICSYKDVFDDCWDIPPTNKILQEGLISYSSSQTPPLHSKIDTSEFPEVESIFPHKQFEYPKLEDIKGPEIPIIDFGF